MLVLRYEHYTGKQKGPEAIIAEAKVRTMKGLATPKKEKGAVTIVYAPTPDGIKNSVDGRGAFYTPVSGDL